MKLTDTNTELRAIAPVEEPIPGVLAFDGTPLLRGVRLFAEALQALDPEALADVLDRFALPGVPADWGEAPDPWALLPMLTGALNDVAERHGLTFGHDPDAEAWGFWEPEEPAPKRRPTISVRRCDSDNVWLQKNGEWGPYAARGRWPDEDAVVEAMDQAFDGLDRHTGTFIDHDGSRQAFGIFPNS